MPSQQHSLLSISLLSALLAAPNVLARRLLHESQLVAARQQLPLDPLYDSEHLLDSILFTDVDSWDEYFGYSGWAPNFAFSSRPALPTPSAPSISQAIPHPQPTALVLDRRALHRRDNLCPFDEQTTVYISIFEGTTTTFSTASGPRPTGIPGDEGFPGDDPNPSDGTGRSGGGNGLSGQEGLLTGIAILVAILLASMCALVSYWYNKRRKARRANLDQAIESKDTPAILRHMGSKGLMSLTGRQRSTENLPKSAPPARSSPTFFGYFTKLWQRSGSKSSNRDSQRSDTSELVEWKQSSRDSHRYANESMRNSSRIGSSHHEETPSNSIYYRPDSTLALPRPPARAASPQSSTAASHGAAPSSSKHHYPNPGPASPPTQPSNLLERSVKRPASGEALTPSAWMAGFDVAPIQNPFADPNTSPFSQQTTTDETTYENIPHHGDLRLSAFRTAVPGAADQSQVSVRPSSFFGTQESRRFQESEEDARSLYGAASSEALPHYGSAFGDRSSSENHSLPERLARSGSSRRQQTSNTQPLEGVAEVESPLEKESMQSDASATPRPGAMMRTSYPEATTPRSIPSAWDGKKQPSRNNSGSGSGSGNGRPLTGNSEDIGSLAGTSIMEASSAPIDASDWDDAYARRQEADRLFYAGAAQADSPRRR